MNEENNIQEKMNISEPEMLLCDQPPTMTKEEAIRKLTEENN